MSWNHYLICWLCCLSSSAFAAETSVLLPLGGATQKAANNIRNGLLTGYYHALSTNSSDSAPLLRFYDTTAINHIDSLVQQISANSQQIIGPLLKEHVSEVLANPPNVPVLALNRINNNQYASIWQFALAPEEEFEPLIQLIQQENIQKIKIIGASDNNSKRLQTGFEQAWLAKNGVLLASYTLSTQTKEDIEQSVKNLLAEPDINDVQAFYLASPQYAQQILALLNFYKRNPVPIYSASQAYNADQAQLERQDLNGLRFCGLPRVIAPEKWVISQKKRQVAAFNNDSDSRLLAFGVDAWLISQQLIQHKRLTLEGQTGLLTIHAGQIKRTPLCAKVTYGKAQAINTTTGTTSGTFGL